MDAVKMAISLRFECRGWDHKSPLEFDTSDWKRVWRKNERIKRDSC